MSFFSFSDYPQADKEYTLAIVVAKFNEEITEQLLEQAFKTLKKCNITEDNIMVIYVAGSFEIPFTVKQLQKSMRYDGIITLGAVIRGETAHFDFVAGECARGIMDCNLQSDIPVVFGVLTCENLEQAVARIERAGDCAKALVEQMNFMNSH